MAGLAALALALTLAAPATSAAQAAAADGGRAADRPPPRIPKRHVKRPAAVLIGGEPILWITAGAGPYSTEFRAERISQRLDDIVRDRTLRDLRPSR